MRLGAHLLLLVGLVVAITGCYDHSRGNPVDRLHYEHTITVTPDYSHVTIQTYVNRTHWRVGLEREDLYDGDRDGKLTTPGMDRVAITDYVDVEAELKDAVRTTGELRDYDSLFQRILPVVKAGKPVFENEGRTYRIRFLSQEQQAAGSATLG